MRRLDDAVREEIELALERAHGKVEGDDGAAALLGVNPSTLRHKMRRLGVAYGRRSRRESSGNP